MSWSAAQTTIVGFSPTDATGPRISSQPLPATRSADGSTRTAPAATACSRSRRAPRSFKGPRAYDATGLPLHFDNQSVFKERIHRDKADPSILHDEITVIDHALTRPWTVDKRYVHNANPHPDWDEAYCTAGTAFIAIGNEGYYLSADGLLMPAKKGLAPPDLRYFKQTQK